MVFTESGLSFIWSWKSESCYFWLSFYFGERPQFLHISFLTRKFAIRVYYALSSTDMGDITQVYNQTKTSPQRLQNVWEVPGAEAPPSPMKDRSFNQMISLEPFNTYTFEYRMRVQNTAPNCSIASHEYGIQINTEAYSPTCEYFSKSFTCVSVLLERMLQ